MDRDIEDKVAEEMTTADPTIENNAQQLSTEPVDAYTGVRGLAFTPDAEIDKTTEKQLAEAEKKLNKEKEDKKNTEKSRKSIDDLLKAISKLYEVPQEMLNPVNFEDMSLLGTEPKSRLFSLNKSLEMITVIANEGTKNEAVIAVSKSQVLTNAKITPQIAINIAILAAHNPEAQKRGVTLVGSEQDKAVLLIAAKKVGLTVINESDVTQEAFEYAAAEWDKLMEEYAEAHADEEVNNLPAEPTDTDLNNSEFNSTDEPETTDETKITENNEPEIQSTDEDISNDDIDKTLDDLGYDKEEYEELMEDLGHMEDMLEEPKDKTATSEEAEGSKAEEAIAEEVAPEEIADTTGDEEEVEIPEITFNDIDDNSAEKEIAENEDTTVEDSRLDPLQKIINQPLSEDNLSKIFNAGVDVHTYTKAKLKVIDDQAVSRKKIRDEFSIGATKAKAILDVMEDEGLIARKGANKRVVLINSDGTKNEEPGGPS
jgi:hypothetical protein